MRVMLQTIHMTAKIHQKEKESPSSQRFVFFQGYVGQ